MLCETCRSSWRPPADSRTRCVAVTMATQRGTYITSTGTAAPCGGGRLAGPAESEQQRIIPALSVPVLKRCGCSPCGVRDRVLPAELDPAESAEIWRRPTSFFRPVGVPDHQLTGEFRTRAATSSAPCVRREAAAWAGKWDLKSRLFRVEREKLPRVGGNRWRGAGHFTAAAAARPASRPGAADRGLGRQGL